MIRILVFLVVLLPSLFSGIDTKNPFSTQQAEVSPPNPADLKINWWDYYDVDGKTLVERKKATEQYFEQVESELSGENLLQARSFFDRILVGLQTLIDLKSERPPAEVPSSSSSPEKKYTYQEWLALSQKLLESQREVQYLEFNLKLADSSYQSGSRHIDTLFAAYLKNSKADFAKMVDGLTIMQGRISLAIEKIQMVNLKKTIEQKQNAFSLVEEEAQHSYRRVDFSTVPSAEINQVLQAARGREIQTYNQFTRAYETVVRIPPTATSLDREFASQNLINAKLDYEIARVGAINLEIQKIIVEFMKKETKVSHRLLRERFAYWKAVTREIQREVPDSENTTEFLLQQSLRSLSLQKEDRFVDLSQQSLQLSQEAILKIQQLNSALFIYGFFKEQLLEMRGDLIFDLTTQVSIWWDNWTEFFKSHSEWFRRSLFKIGDFPVTPSAIVKFFLILAISFILARLARTAVNYLGKKQTRVNVASVYIWSRLSYYFVFVFGLLMAGKAIGLDLTIFAYLAGAIAIWIGFSLQSIFHNFISGIIVLLTRSVRINDFLELETGELGTVVDINLRTTILRGLDGRYLIIPNADLVNKKFYNHTYAGYLRRFHIPFRISLQEDRDVIAKIVIEAAKKVPETSAYRDPELWITGYEDYYRKVELVVWVNGLILPKLGSWVADYYWALDEALTSHNVIIPIPERNVHLTQT